MALEFRPTWSWIGDKPVSDYDAGLLHSWTHVYAGLGYRWVKCRDSTLNGAFAGVSARL